jgi:predicted nuclease with RNAse H fold
MRTLGIDLAAQDKNTASCAIAWGAGSAVVELPALGVSDADLLASMAAADWTGIDAPFGWPEALIEAVGQFSGTGVWPGGLATERLRHRTTDLRAHELIKDLMDVSLWPLSVSSNHIAACAWRCARLLTEHAMATGRPLDRVAVSPGAESPADHGIAEVYPAAALALWGMRHKGYKAGASTSPALAHEIRGQVLAGLERAAGPWLTLSGDVRTACLDTDHTFDALIAALVARAAATGRTVRPSAGERGVVGREGWIHLPVSDSLARLLD